MKSNVRAWIAFVLMTTAMLVVGCSTRQVQFQFTPDAIPPEVIMLTRTVDYYLAEYQREYSVRSRVGETPQEIAEAYLREYQPGPLPRVFETTYIYDRHGELLAELIDEGYRTWVPLDRISEHVIDAVVATEDASFFHNPGYDARRIIGAMLQNVEAGEVVSGASTITMQLARHLFFSTTDRFDQNMDRKAYEALLAQDLTMLYSKNEILEMYLNLVHFGRTAYGIEAAAQLYFGKRASELDVAEATLLAGLPQQPGDYDLYRNMDAAKQRQRIVLDLMVRHGHMPAVEAAFIHAQEIELQPESRLQQIRHAPHFVQHVLVTLDEEMGGIDVRRSGMRIVTTLDLSMHELAQSVVAEQVAILQPNYDLSNGALVVLKPGSAEILAMVGSADFDNPAIAGQVNVTTRLRQPGSAIKPMLYALALDDGLISPASVIWDLEAVFRVSQTETYRPRNYDRTFHGPVTVRSALGNSYNIPAVKLLDAVGIDRMLEGTRQLGIHSLTRDSNWYGLSLTLGGGDVTLLDLTSAYHTLANGGGYVAPQTVLFTQGAHDGQNYRLSNPEITPVIAPEAAFLVTDIMQDNEARTPAFGANSPLRLDVPAAVKTGTTDDWRDNWTVGYTPYLVAGVWAGNSDGRPMRNVSGVTGAAPIWQAFMAAVLEDPVLLGRLGAPEDLDAWEFAAPPGVVEMPIDCPARVWCPETEYFDASWVELMGDWGPLGDSALSGGVRTVYVSQGGGNRPVGACLDRESERTTGGAVRTLHRVPMGIGGNLPSAAPFDALVELDSATADTPVQETRAQRIRQEQQAVLNWSARNGVPLHFGPCDQVELAARSVFGANVTVRVENFVEAVAMVEDEQDEQDEQDEVVQEVVPTPASTAALATQTASGTVSSRFNVMGVARDNSCGGTYVLGLVGDAQGGLVPGVRVVMTDSLGNRAETVTSGDPANYGSFRIPIQQTDEARDMYVSLYNAQGAAIGGPAHVQYGQGGASDLPCHHVIWQGAD